MSEKKRKQFDIQSHVLNQYRKERRRVIVSFVDGKGELEGVVKSFDPYCILMDIAGSDYLIFKHSIKTIDLKGRFDLRSSDQ